ncbi:MAG TPA: hypothetical protein VF403_03620 [Kofleriaceae bacterium]
MRSTETYDVVQRGAASSNEIYLVDATAADLHLTASAGVPVGTSLPNALCTTDADGKPRDPATPTPTPESRNVRCT